VIDPSSATSGIGAKIGFDATRGAGTEFDKIEIPAAAVTKARAIVQEMTSQ
jgi:2,5-furandicarboxylate decarboxylase 1